MTKSYKILSIEDNEPDFILLKNALKKISNINFEIKNIQNGNDAINFLYNKDTDLPDLILLDLNIPQIDGQELLSIVKNNDTLQSIPIIIVTTSDNIEIIKSTYKNHANAYIIKSFDINKLFEKIKNLSDFWFKSVEIPNN